ncbi:MAG: 3-methyl-2-oxobutanoate dehydrogenase subunit beta, partial [Eggerthellaceae bacterium]|nr:3-methyl-2-oxobutanoate dehydrogenase subunit beta [Eggerthellaceae bacterium]
APVPELADVAYNATDVADEYRMPVRILRDGMLGQMLEPVERPEPRTELPEKPWATTGHGNARKKNIANSLYLDAEKLEKSNIERFERYEVVKREEQRAELVDCDDADIVVVAFGASSRIVRSAVRAAREEGIKAGLFRPITLWPYPADALEATKATAKAYLSVEMNMGQMVEDVRLVVRDAAPVDFFGRVGGVIPTPAEVLEKIRAINEGLGE